MEKIEVISIRYNSSHIAKHEFLFWDQLDFKLLKFVDQMSTESMKLLQVTQSYITADIIMKSKFSEALEESVPSSVSRGKCHPTKFSSSKIKIMPQDRYSD